MGGGALLYGGNGATLSNNLFIGNVVEIVSGLGGGMLGAGEGFELIGNTFSGNTAQVGGGLALSESSATLTANTLQANVAADGGGAWFVNCGVVLNGNTILSNTASTGSTGWGGGLYLDGGAAVLADNVILANHATLGGGLHLTDQDTATLKNNIVADNQAEDAGSGLYIERGSSRLWHTTLARNTGGDGSGLHIGGSYGTGTVALTNTILVSQTVGITVAAGTINLWGDPAFVNPSAGDYHLGQGSAAIDAGIDAGVTTDIDGDPRPLGLGFDLGADEFRSPEFAPDIVVEPDSLSAELCLDDSTVLTFTICNVGTEPLNWMLHEMLAALSRERIAALPGGGSSTAKAAESPVGRPGGPVHPFLPGDILLDEGFEGGVVPPPGWARIQTNPRQTWKIQTVGTPYQGAYSADVEYDDQLALQDEVLLTSEFVLESGVLSFWSMGSLYWCRDT
jgi:hypothetical protein